MRFFFYGTLIDGSDNPMSGWVHDLLRPLGLATCAGVLHAIPNPEGWYPALLTGEGTVHGRLYASREGFGTADLARLDAYEDFDPARPADSLYVRESVAVTGENGTVVAAQAYRFNRPLPAGAQPIPCGDLRAWLAGAGQSAFGGRHGG